MEKHLIILDMDGTILNSDSKLTDFTKDTLKKVQDLGHLVVIATGRPYHASIDTYNLIDLNGPIITDNGGNIREPKNPEFQTVIDGIPVKISHQIFEFAKPFVESAFYSYGDFVYSYKHLDRLHNIFIDSNKATVIHADFLDYDHSPTGMIYLIDIAFKAQFEKYLTTDLKDFVNFRLWGADSKHAIYEIYKRGSSKLSGIHWVARHNQVKEENIFAFGDGLNDIEMLSGLKNGYAMANAEDEVKRVASNILPYSNNEDGVAKFLIEYFNL